MTAARHPLVTFLLVGLFVLDVASGTNTPQTAYSYFKTPIIEHLPNTMYM